MDLMTTKHLYNNLLLPRQELRDEIFWLLRSVLLRKPLGHDMGGLLPMLDYFLEVLLALNHQHINDSDVFHPGILSKLSPESSPTITNSSGERKVFAHEWDVTIPGLVQTEHPDLGVLRVRGQEWLDLSGHCGSSAGHALSSATEKYVNNESRKEILLRYKITLGLVANFVRKISFKKQISQGDHLISSVGSEFS